MTLDATVSVRLGDFDLDVALRAEAGETIAILGPNGAGKSTLLRCLAGLLPADRASVELAGRTLDDTATGVRVAPQERRVGMVFQQHLLFPSMSALDNVAFGLRSRGASKAESRQRAQALLASVGLAHKETARPDQLSGGQSQRVALARALATDPDLVLLDEPLAALDVTTRAEIRRELRTHLDRLPCVRLLVTHDPVDAFALADRVVVIEHGRITQAGPIVDVTTRPTTRYLADLMGLNLFAGTVAGSTFTHDDGSRWTITGAHDGPAFAAVHPRHVHVVDAPATGANTCSGTVDSIDLERDRAVIRVTGSVPIAAEAAPSAMRTLRHGDHLTMTVDPVAIECYPRAGTAS